MVAWRRCGQASTARRHRVSASLASLASARSPQATIIYRQVHSSAQGPGHDGEVCCEHSASAPCATAAGVSANLQLDRRPVPGRAAGDLSELNRPSSLDSLSAHLWHTRVRNAVRPSQAASTNHARNGRSQTFQAGLGRSFNSVGRRFEPDGAQPTFAQVGALRSPLRPGLSERQNVRSPQRVRTRL